MISNKCKIIEPNNPIDKLLYDTFTYELRKGYVEIGEEKICMPLSYKDIADRIENFEVRDTDIFVVTHPKAGTTWCQEMVWMIINNLDYEGAKDSLVSRFPFLEFQCIFDYSWVFEKDPDAKIHPGKLRSVQICEELTCVPRLIKSHLPMCLLPKALREGKTKAKIIYVARNPKDVCVSYYNHGILLEGFKGTFEQYCRLFLAGRTHSGPYWSSVLPFWHRRNDPNILYITYEDMKRDLISIIRKVSDFLIHKQYPDDQLQKLVDHLNFESMKKNPSVNYEVGRSNAFVEKEKGIQVQRKFMRSGTVGSYKAEMTAEFEAEFDEWIKKNTEGIDISF